MKLLVNFAYILVLIAISPIALYRMLRHKRYRAGWRQRLGRIDRKKPDKKCIWLHAVSLGEINAAKTVIDALEKEYPDFEIAISVTTDTGYGRAIELYGQKHTVFYFPLDFSFIMRRAFKNISPDICLLMELEVWYNFTNIAASMNIPVIVVNGRLSEKSFGRYKKIRPLIKSMFQKISIVLAQTDDYAQRFKFLGCPPENVIVTGSLKYDTANISDTVEGAALLAEKLSLGETPLWVAGGTGPGEEKIILDIYRDLIQNPDLKSLRLAIIPRKPERFDEVAQMISQSGFDTLRYSEVKESKIQNKHLKTDAVILGDTMGDLRKFYSLASVIFVGRSLVPMGGSDMMEAAALNKCTIFGPYAFNFEQTVNALLAGDGAVMAKDKDDLRCVVEKSLLDTATAARIAANGQNIIKKNQGATAASIKAISKILAQKKSCRIFISAAEPSADIHCANLIAALKSSGRDIELVGLGGKNMAAAGCELLENMTERAAMHYNVLGQIGWYHRLLKRVKSYFAANKVDLAIVCDSPSFNFHIAKAAKKAGVKTLFYVAPQLWAWGGWRIKKMRRLCDKLACILPFEQQWFKDRGIAAEFVGNPLFDDVPAEILGCRNRVFNAEKPVIALMPGSRPGEIATLWRPMQQIALKLAQRHIGARFIVVAANEKILETLKNQRVDGLQCEYSLSSVISTAYNSDLALVASGSATLQVAGAGCPMVVMYQSNKILWNLIGKRLLKVPRLSLVNILADKDLVPEFMPYFDSIEPIYSACEKLLSNLQELSRLSMELTELARPLRGQDASQKTAQIVLSML